jgi:hypothetical protein
VGLLDIFTNDLSAIMNELPLAVTFGERNFLANRTTYRRDNSLADGGFMDSASMTITAIYDAFVQTISLGDILIIGGRRFRVTSAELSQDAVSVDFSLEDINK